MTQYGLASLIETTYGFHWLKPSQITCKRLRQLDAFVQQGSFDTVAPQTQENLVINITLHAIAHCDCSAEAEQTLRGILNLNPHLKKAALEIAKRSVESGPLPETQQAKTEKKRATRIIQFCL